MASSHEPSRTCHAASNAVQKRTRLLEHTPTAEPLHRRVTFTTFLAVSQCRPGDCHPYASRARYAGYYLEYAVFKETETMGAQLERSWSTQLHFRESAWFGSHVVRRSPFISRGAHWPKQISLSLLVPADKTQNTAGLEEVQKIEVKLGTTTVT